MRTRTTRTRTTEDDDDDNDDDNDDKGTRLQLAACSVPVAPGGRVCIGGFHSLEIYSDTP